MWWAAVGAGAAWLAWAARGRSSQVFGPSVWRGPRHRREAALTFDDGPTPSTPRLLEVLEDYGVRATFFCCGVQVERRPDIARAVAAAGHEIGNHSYSHARFWLRGPGFLYGELARAQEVITQCTGVWPRWFRAPFGVRWFGLARAQRRLGLLGVMWTVLARDWKLPADAVAARLLDGLSAGAIFCLHDGRGTAPDPDIGPTVEAVRRAVPAMLARGYRLVTVSELLRSDDL